MLGGSSPLVTPGGYILGGGHSPIIRMKGLGVDQVVAFEMVTANGNIVHMTDEGKDISVITCRSLQESLLSNQLHGQCSLCYSVYRNHNNARNNKAYSSITKTHFVFIASNVLDLTSPK